MPQSEELTEFYRSYAIWLEEGAPQWEPFSRTEGLCWSVLYFATHCGYRSEALLHELREQFEAAGLSQGYPFDEGGMAHSKARTNATMHTNPKRIQWVRERI